MSGKLEAKNSGGSIEVGLAHDAVVLRTSSGNVSVNFANAPESDSRMEVSGGGIRIGLPRTAGVELDAQASGGGVTSVLPVAIIVQGEQPRSGLKGKINGGGPALFLRSSSGDIRITESPAQQAEADK